jgi:hypothetical protein
MLTIRARIGGISLTDPQKAPVTEGSDWDQTYLDAGYEWCRPCREWHRPPECPIDEQGRPLNWQGVPWDE